MTCWRMFTVAAAVVLMGSTQAHGWLRLSYQDVEVVKRSEIIVVGHLDKDSIKYVAHKVPPGSGISWEYHATLIVTTVLKGELKEKQIPIVINYGLDPLIGGRVVRENENIGMGEPDHAIPKDRVDIVDTGNSCVGGPPVLEDAQKDNLWFLRHLGGDLGREAGKGPLGILDPEDVAAIKFKAYFEALLSKDVDEKVGRLLTDPDEAVLARVLRHLSAQHRPQDTKRIAELISSPIEKVQALAAEAMAEVSDMLAVPMFRQELAHKNPQVRTAACIFLCRFRDRESVTAIAKAMQGLDGTQQQRVIGNLPRMQSRQVVDVLIDQLDERFGPKEQPSAAAFGASNAAAGALRTMTGIDFPLDSGEARKLWEKFKEFDDEVLLRKTVLEDIEALTDPTNCDVRWSAYENLGRTANQHFGSYNAFHGNEDPAGREKSQALWRQWAKENITKTRAEWLYGGFAGSGIDLPRPIDAKGIETLLAVLNFYDDWGNSKQATTKPNWSADGGWVKAKFHQYNADRLLEEVTGYRVGLCPYQYDLRVAERDEVRTRRWAAWWKDNQAKAKLLPLPEEKPVTAEMLAKVPPMRQLSCPLSLAIRAKGEGPQDVTFEVKNVYSGEITLAKRPYEIGYRGSSLSGGCGGGEENGHKKQEDYVTLKPGEILTWEHSSAPKPAVTSKPPQDLQYVLTYPFAGSQFGLHAWRGKLVSNVLNAKSEDKK